MTVLSVFPEPMTCPSLSSISTLMYGSVIISIGSLVPALPFILPFTTGLGGGVVSVVLTGLETELFGRAALSVALHKHCLQELVLLV